jgi:hypothetical protein
MTYQTIRLRSNLMLFFAWTAFSLDDSYKSLKIAQWYSFQLSDAVVPSREYPFFSSKLRVTDFPILVTDKITNRQRQLSFS